MFEISVEGKRDDTVAGSHNFARGVIGKLNQVLDGVLLELLQVALVAAGLHDVFELFGRVAAASITCAQTESAKKERGEDQQKLSKEEQKEIQEFGAKSE